MDHYINPEALELCHPLRKIKLVNYQQACDEYDTCAVELKSLPSKIILQTTEKCNLACPMCQLPKSKKKHDMSIKIFTQVMRQLFPTLIELHPTNVGEPLMSTWFDFMCKQMQHFGILLDLTTNGTLLNEQKIAKIAPIARDIKISFDGACPQTFEKIRPHANFNVICNNIKKLRQAIDQQKFKRKVILALQMTLMKSNFRELPQLIKLANNLGANCVKAYHLFSISSEMDKESLMNNLEIWTPVLEKSLALGKLYNIDLQLAEPLMTENKTPPRLIATICHLPWHEAWIDYDGNVYSCHSHGGKSAGNILQKSFMEIWNSSLYQDIRNNFAKREPKKYCEKCGMNYRKIDEHQPILYDQNSFLSARNLVDNKQTQCIRWSSRMKQFDLTNRHNYD